MQAVFNKLDPKFKLERNYTTCTDLRDAFGASYYRYYRKWRAQNGDGQRNGETGIEMYV